MLERAYKFGRVGIAEVLLELVATDCLVIESAQDVTRSALRYRQGGPGFSDLMIVAAANRVGTLPLHAFDDRLAAVEGATLLRAHQS